MQKLGVVHYIFWMDQNILSTSHLSVLLIVQSTPSISTYHHHTLSQCRDRADRATRPGTPMGSQCLVVWQPEEGSN